MKRNFTAVVNSLAVSAITTLFALFLLTSCNDGTTSNQKNATEDKASLLWGNDPKNGAIVYENPYSHEDVGQSVTIQTDDDGCQLWRNIENESSMTTHIQLFSPNGNLRLVAAGASEAGTVFGYRISHNTDGSVSQVEDIGELNEEPFTGLFEKDEQQHISLLKEWLQAPINEDKYIRYSISYNDKKEIIKAGDIHCPNGYRIKCYIGEWGPFWFHDIEGGNLQFFVLLENIKDTDGSYVNYLYCNNRLVAEYVYWKDNFIKARTYNQFGAAVSEYSDREMDVMLQAYYDQWESTKWYIKQ